MGEEERIEKKNKEKETERKKESNREHKKRRAKAERKQPILRTFSSRLYIHTQTHTLKRYEGLATYKKTRLIPPFSF